ncbi:MAG: hypothetical protein LBL13_01265 [Bacteroidales bacterium]|jgi:hypothetical protein|nr:hypothetical protein [Bacteroidales bacterium]
MKTNSLNLLALIMILLSHSLVGIAGRASPLSALTENRDQSEKMERIFLATTKWEAVIYFDGSVRIEISKNNMIRLVSNLNTNTPIYLPAGSIDYVALREIIQDRLKKTLPDADKHIIEKTFVQILKIGESEADINENTYKYVDYTIWNNFVDEVVEKMGDKLEYWIFWERIRYGVSIKIEPVDYIGESREIQIVPLTQDTLLMQWIIGWRIYFFKDGSISVRRRLAESKEIEVATAPAKSVDDEWIKYRLVSAWNSGFEWEKQYGQRHDFPLLGSVVLAGESNILLKLGGVYYDWNNFARKSTPALQGAIIPTEHNVRIKPYRVGKSIQPVPPSERGKSKPMPPELKTIKWSEIPSAIGLSTINQLLVDETNDTFTPKPVETRSEAILYFNENTIIPVVPTSAYESEDYYYFSGGTRTYPVTDFSTGLAIEKKTGRIFSW